MKVTLGRSKRGNYTVYCDGKPTDLYISRGDYYNTPDDNIHRWYVQMHSWTYVDRTSEGYYTKAEALEGAEDYIRAFITPLCADCRAVGSR